LATWVELTEAVTALESTCCIGKGESVKLTRNKRQVLAAGFKSKQTG